MGLLLHLKDLKCSGFINYTSGMRSKRLLSGGIEALDRYAIKTVQIRTLLTDEDRPEISEIQYRDDNA